VINDLADISVLLQPEMKLKTEKCCKEWSNRSAASRLMWWHKITISLQGANQQIMNVAQIEDLKKSLWSKRLKLKLRFQKKISAVSFYNSSHYF